MASVEVETAARVFARDHFCCVYCGFDGSTFERWRYLAVDHFIPQSRGGSNDETNLKTACIDCNSMKASFRFETVEEARQKIAEWIAGERRAFETAFAPYIHAETATD